jgi:hypothetical protein
MRTRPTTLVAGLAVLLALAVGACGKPSALEQTQNNMAKLKAATMDLRLAASAGAGDSASGPVGFRLKGPFAFSTEHDLAVFDLDYTQLLGSDARTTEVRSTGEAAFVTAGGKTYRVADHDLGSLRVSKSTKGGFADLGIAGWVKDAKVKSGATVDGARTEVITGNVNVGDLLSDLARTAGPLGGDDQLAALDEGAAERLQHLVRASTITVITGAEDRQLRSLRAVMDFGTTAPRELRNVLGKYADARIEVRLALTDRNKSLRVKAPVDYVTL